MCVKVSGGVLWVYLYDAHAYVVVSKLGFLAVFNGI